MYSNSNLECVKCIQMCVNCKTNILVRVSLLSYFPMQLNLTEQNTWIGIQVRFKRGNKRTLKPLDLVFSNNVKSGMLYMLK